MRTTTRTSLLSICLLLTMSLSGIAEELVVRNAKIVTVDGDFRIAEAMAISDGWITAIGSDQEIASRIDSDTRVLDAEGRMVLPGLIDSHVHPTGASKYEADHQIPTMESIQDVLDYIQQRTQVVPEGEWIVLQQVFITRLREQRFPTREELDAVAPKHPVWFRTGPDGSANSLALEENGIDKEFAAEHPQHVMVDPDTGKPTGVLRQSSAVFRSGGNWTQGSLTQEQLDDQLSELLADYNRWGITGIIDRNCGDSARSQYVRLLQSDRLTTRVRLSRSLSPNGELDDIQQRLDAIAEDTYFQKPDPRLGVIGVKVFEDGGMLTGSAYFKRPWGTSEIYGISEADYRGMQFIDRQRLEELVRAAVKRGLAFTAHCQGDAAVEALVNAYRAVDVDIPVAPTHSSITHSSFMSPEAIEGAAELGVGVDLQPAWLYLDARTLVKQFGDQRLEHFIPLRTLFEAGVVAGGGSDHMQKIGSLRSVNPYNPFLGMWIAVTRQARWHDQPIHPEQGLNREQMIRFYTINNAWLMRYQDEIGSLEVGKRADFIIIDRDLLNCDVDAIRDTRVLSTWLDGHPIHETDIASPTADGVGG